MPKIASICIQLAKFVGYYCPGILPTSQTETLLFATIEFFALNRVMGEDGRLVIKGSGKLIGQPPGSI